MIPARITLTSKEGNYLYRGFLQENDNDKQIQYLDENMDTVKVFIGNNRIVITRNNSIMEFDTNHDSKFEYKTDFGSLIFRIATREIVISECFCKIEYSLYDEYDNLAYQNKISMEYIKE